MDALRHLLPVLVVAGMLLLAWPLARSAGKAQAQRMRGLRADLRHGRTRGLYVVIAVVVLIAISQFDYLLRR